MLFTTTRYAIFFAVAFALSWALAALKSPWPRVLFLLAASYAFYAAWKWQYLPLIFASSTVDFFLARAIGREERPARKKVYLVATVVLNLGFLGFFKYAGFAVENLAALRALATGAPPDSEASTIATLLPPVGISFFTFESMSYVVDVYRGDIERFRPYVMAKGAADTLRHYVRYLLFVSFFPHLVAGPIVRPRDLLPQLEAHPSLSREDGGEALFLIAIGLLKKLVISDQLATNLVDRVFQRPESFSALEVLAGVYGYAIQIYCDFSGYTDIAIGSALLLGVRFPKNFDSPYKAHNLADFWHRWHISLSTWLRDYLYVPLGGSRGTPILTYRNLLITMVLGGLWHGASWTFVVWGLMHGVGLALTRAWQRSRGPNVATSPLRRALGVLFTFHYVCLAWVFFRAKSFGGALLVLRRVATLTTFHPNLPIFVVALLGIGLASHYLPESAYLRIRRAFVALPAPAQGAVLFVVALLLHETASLQQVPFVYFQF